MKARLLALVVAGGLFGTAIVACATPADTEGSGLRDDDQTEPKGTGKKKSTTAPPVGGETPTPGAATPLPSTPATNDAGAPDSATEAGADAAPPPPAAPVCARVSTCANARVVSGVSGDGLGTTSTTTGAGSQWISVTVREDSFSSEWVGVNARVTSPAEGDYEVYVYGSDCRSLLDYGTVDYRGIATAYTEWPDNYALDDTRTIMIEVRYVGGKCQADQPWRLDVEGGVVY